MCTLMMFLVFIGVLRGTRYQFAKRVFRRLWKLIGALDTVLCSNLAAIFMDLVQPIQWPISCWRGAPKVTT
jgi:hypothetical protein